MTLWSSLNLRVMMNPSSPTGPLETRRWVHRRAVARTPSLKVPNIIACVCSQ